MKIGIDNQLETLEGLGKKSVKCSIQQLKSILLVVGTMGGGVWGGSKTVI